MRGRGHQKYPKLDGRILSTKTYKIGEQNMREDRTIFRDIWWKRPKSHWDLMRYGIKYRFIYSDANYCLKVRFTYTFLCHFSLYWIIFIVCAIKLRLFNFSPIFFCVFTHPLTQWSFKWNTPLHGFCETEEPGDLHIVLYCMP